MDYRITGSPELVAVDVADAAAGDDADDRLSGVSVWTYLGLPLVWIANLAMAGYAVLADANLVLVPLVALVFNSVVFVALERLVPYRASWHPNAREWLGGAGYFTINILASLSVQAAVAALAITMATGHSPLPMWLDAPVALLLVTFAGYWVHRWFHESPLGWKVHSVHHNPEKQSMWFTNYTHVIEIAAAGLATQVPMLLLGSSPQVVVLVNAFLSVQSYATHCNADLRIGWFNRVIGSPEQHRLHHSQDLDEAGNYGGFIPLWDMLFGTFTWRPGREPVKVGIANATMPPPESVLRNMIYPFVGAGR